MIRPLDRIGSFKLKIGVLVAASICAAAVVFWRGIGWSRPATVLIAIAVALIVTQLLAHGMTSPLRDMTAAAGAMARGDYAQRVRDTSRDEVGELGRAFNKMAEDLAVADRQRRELIANVSHELRTPISALQAVLENVVDGVTDPSHLRSALAQTERLGRLVSELLDMSRLDAGVLPLRRELVEVAPFLADVVAQSLVAGEPTDVDVAVDPPDLHMYADPQRLHQVLANLVENARRHSPPDGRVSLLATDTGTGIALEVVDEGPGIRPEERDRVFERFIRGVPQADSDGGTGLGLAIARWAVDLHGGTIGVVGDAPGCRIRVTLPPPDASRRPAVGQS
ncbi:MAG: HAMP domain-containing sensor histidine kinase [Actinocatenispora sp.]